MLHPREARHWLIFDVPDERGSALYRRLFRALNANAYAERVLRLTAHVPIENGHRVRISKGNICGSQEHLGV
jgi:hypothetical protein